MLQSIYLRITTEIDGSSQRFVQKNVAVCQKFNRGTMQSSREKLKLNIFIAWGQGKLTNKHYIPPYSQGVTHIYIQSVKFWKINLGLKPPSLDWVFPDKFLGCS